MGLFEDLNRFLENRLDEFLRNNPHLELQALEEQLGEQEKDTSRLIIDLQSQEKTLQNEILTIAQDIQLWHGRVEKARANGRQDLAQGAQEREAALLHQGNQVWGKMQGVKQRIAQTQELQRQIQTRRAEVKAKAKEVSANRPNFESQSPAKTSEWNHNYQRTFSIGNDPLEQQFNRWETEAELEEMKRKMGR